MIKCPFLQINMYKIMKKNNLLKIFSTNTLKIYKNKKLNNANFGNFTHSDYQVFLHLVSKIGGVNEVGKYSWMQVPNASWLSFLRPSKFQKGY